MKKLVTGVLALAVVAAFAAPAFAAPVFVEDFNYSAPSALAGQGGWVQTGTVTSNPLTVNSPGLTYAGYPNSGIGNMVGTTATSGQDDNHTFTGITGGAAYAAFMVNIVSAQTTGDYFFHFFDGAVSSNTFRGRVFAKKDASSANYAFGIQFGSTVNTVYTGFNYVPGTTYLLVVKYTFNPSTADDATSLFVNPDLSCIEPTALVTATDATQTDATNLDAIGVRQGTAANAPTFQIDGIRVASTWGDAVCDLATPTKSSSWGGLKSLYR